MNGWKAKIKKERKNEELKETIISVHSGECKINCVRL